MTADMSKAMAWATQLRVWLDRQAFRRTSRYWFMRKRSYTYVPFAYALISTPAVSYDDINGCFRELRKLNA